MHSFDSPLRQNSSQNSQQVVQRQGDWICYHCNNLNFSFRKRCNRCRSQTKEQNEQMDSFYKYGVMVVDSRALQERTNFSDIGENNLASNRKNSQNTSADLKKQIINPQQLNLCESINYSPCFQNVEPYSPCNSEGLGWHIFLSSDEEVWDKNSLSESSGENEELDEQVDYDIEQMVTRLII